MSDAGVLPGFRGTAVHDGYAPYRNFIEALHALCNAHHLRELLAAEEQGEAWAIAMSCLLLDTKELVEQAKAAGLTQLSEQQLTELHASYREVIKLGYEAEPRPRTPHHRAAAQAHQGRRTYCCALISANRRRCASPTTSGSRSTTTSASATCGWSSSSRRSPAAGAPARAPSDSSRSAPTSRPPESKASARSRSSPLTAGQPWLPHAAGP